MLSVSQVLLALVLTLCGGGVIALVRLISRYTDAQMEKTRQALRAQHRESGYPPAAARPAATGDPAARSRSRVTASRDTMTDSEIRLARARHRVPDELLRASTHRLSADRLSRVTTPRT